MEILAPVKNLESAKIAIQNNCDAIYLGSSDFGARVNASIKKEEIKEIIEYANKYDVKTYVAFNTVIFEDEIESFFQQIDYIYKEGATGIILQDPSFIKILKTNYPELEIHCSTQMNIHNEKACNLVEELGSNRVVLPREMTFERIKNLRKKTNLDFEVFVHGALCVCYSGLCFDSTLLDQKSANRGRCSQYCRMEQKIKNKKNNIETPMQYPLNLKDLNNLENIEKYKESGINSLKIEGRLKNIDYVGKVTNAYYQKLRYNKTKKLDDVYNRQFTSGRINGKNGSELVNLNRPNNNGKLIGEIIDVKKNQNKKLKYYPYIIKIKTNDEINKLDNLRYCNFTKETGEIIEQFEKYDNYYLIYSKQKATKGMDVYKTFNYKIYEKEKQKEKQYLRRNKIKGEINFETKEIMINDKICIFDILLEKPQKYITTKNDIKKELTKTKNTCYDLDLNIIYEEKYFINNKELKKLKREIIKIIDEIKNIKRTSKKISYLKQVIDINQEKTEYYFEIRTKKQYNFLKNKKNINIVINNIELAKEINPKENEFLLLPRVIYEDEIEDYQEICKKFKTLIVSELGMLKKFKKTHKIITNFTLNTTNSYNQKFLINNNVQKTIVSIELNKEKIKQIANNSTIINIYGRIPIMIMEYCPINLEKTNTCGNCRRCRSGNYYLEDKLERKFPLLYEGNNRIGMYSNQIINLIDKRGELENYGVKNFYLLFSDESPEEIENVYDIIFNNNKNNLKQNYGSYYKEVL